MADRISHSELLRLVDYDPETGIFTRKVRTSNRVHVGDRVGTISGAGYWMGHIGGYFAYLHQFAWLYVHGGWPERDIDHENTIKTDNRFSNLRLATDSQNLSNTGRKSNNTSGFKGVTAKRDKWAAEIKFDGRRFRLGSFHTKEQAYAAYCEAAHRIHGEFARVA